MGKTFRFNPFGDTLHQKQPPAQTPIVPQKGMKAPKRERKKLNGPVRHTQFKIGDTFYKGAGTPVGMFEERPHARRDYILGL